VITGTMTDICVLSTVVGAFNREYRISVVADGVATLWPEIQRAALDIVGRAFGRVVQSKEVLDVIQRW
jgi:nicotinamidase-related amidase